MKKEEKRKQIKIVVKAVAIIIAAIIFFYLVNEFVLSSRLGVEDITRWINSFGVLAPVAFIIIFIVDVIFFIPATPIVILGGFLFGPVLGTIYNVIGATLGSLASFLIARKLGKRFVQRILKDRMKMLYELERKVTDKGIKFMIFMRVQPLFPFVIINPAMGLTKLKTKDFMIGSIIGFIPVCAVYSYAGYTASNPNIKTLLIAAGLLLLFFGIPLAMKIIKHKKKKK